MFETATLGFRFMLMRLILNIIGILLIAVILARSTSGLPQQNA